MIKLTAVALLSLTLFAADGWRDQGIIYLDHSPNAAMHPVPVRAVTLGDGFWQPRRRVNVERSIPTMLELLEAHGILDNFRRLAAKKDVPRKGPLYTDSDLYKWMEAVAFVLQSGDNPKLRATFDAITTDIAAAQEPSGYLNTNYVGDKAPLRFTEMYKSHELYCLGHLLQAGIAYYRATGNRNLLDVGIRFVDYLVADFGPTKRPLLTGHPELEMALVELYRTTGNRAYLDLAGYLLSGVETERLHLKPSQTSYMFSGLPFTSRTIFEGHAVRAMYASSGATDYFLESGDQLYRKTLDTLWADLTNRKMYITGGVGSRSEGEAFGDPYELPNSQAYTESCAAIGNMMWNFRMLAASAESRYADIMERALYNGINSGMSLEGTLYCYRNPLASDGEKIRNEWYDTTCCPPNLERTLAALPGYFYATGKDGLYVNFYHDSVLDWQGLKVWQKTNYPWSGDVDFTVTPDAAREFTIFLRIPEWSKNSNVSLSGSKTAAAAGQYLAVRRTWKPGDKFTLHLDMTPRLIAANPRISEDTGKVAVQRGPLVYCLEQPDQSGKIPDLSLIAKSEFASEFRKDLFGGVVVLKHAGAVYQQPLDREPLYETLDQATKRKTNPAQLTFIPYYAWANREPSAMEVWVPLAPSTAVR
ncbi:MAG TPA: beta-L-arabinofuranosidase domain-containing protein [Bryobacteraceae bacterium]|nr:beta-L-arabinofuranosidase domain-containing protein [Bryobacteraceae bacterium]